MRILCIGDVVSQEGIDFLCEKLPRLKRQYQPDAVIVNGENSARGNGIDEYAYEQIISAGADVVTGGNHSFQKKTAGALHEEKKRLIRPANMPDNVAGRGELILDFCRFRLRVINLSGSLCMSECINPFEYVQKLLETDTDAVTVVDFHAEATSEKQALGYFLDGRVSLVYGTHTHVQTNDARILPKGTGYMTDIGMTGVRDSVIGKAIECCVHNFRFPDQRMQISNAKGSCILCGVFAQIDEKSKKCTDISPVFVDN